MKTCKVDLCDKPHKAKGYCDKHYKRMQRLGTIKLTSQHCTFPPSLFLQRLRQSQIEEAFFKARKVVKPYRDSLEF